MKKVEFHAVGSERKQLVTAISEALHIKAVYKKVPTCAYEIGDFTVTKEGALTWESAEDALVQNALKAAEEAGFHSDEAAIQIVQEKHMEKSTEPETSGLTVSIPLHMVNTEHLTRLLEAKGGLIQKALGIKSLAIDISDSKVSFPWFCNTPEPEEADAYTHLITALCRLSMEQKRVTMKNSMPENEKYAFRCLLLRLGFIGKEYQTARKILLRNLSGDCAWKARRDLQD